MKPAIQLDFDGTITEEDISYMLLDAFASGEWREHLKDYESGKITVGTFNRRVFSMVKASREEMLQMVLSSPAVRVRPGFKDFIDYCQDKGYYVEITSNGLRFYIEAILEHEGIHGIVIHAAENVFRDGRLEVSYIGPDGREIDAEFKAAYTRRLKEHGYYVIYAGNGKSDIDSARIADHVFATEDLLLQCRREGLSCTAFKDFHDILAGMKTLDSICDMAG